MEPKDWTLLVIASAEGESVEPVQLQKTLFLLGANLGAELLEGEFYRFRPYHYGPFCVDVYHDADELASQGLIVVRRDGARPFREYLATPAGLERAKRIEESLPALTQRYLKSLVAWVRSKSFMDLLRSIYEAYPHMKARSVFQG